MNIMDLNKWLCKHFDEDDKGEVTAKDVLVGLLWIVVPILLVALYIHGAISLYKLICAWSPDYPPLLAALRDPEITIFLLVTGIVMYAWVSYIIPRILGARIAKCEQKDGDETS